MFYNAAVCSAVLVTLTAKQGNLLSQALPDLAQHSKPPTPVAAQLAHLVVHQVLLTMLVVVRQLMPALLSDSVAAG